MPNQNSVEYLEKIKIKIFENLKETTFVPSVEMQDIPRVSLGMDDEDEAILDDRDEDENPDVRMTQRRRDQAIEASGELSDSEGDDSDSLDHKKEGPRGPRNEANFKDAKYPASDTEMNDVESSYDSDVIGSSPSDEGVNGSVAASKVASGVASPSRAKASNTEAPLDADTHMDSPAGVQEDSSKASPTRGVGMKPEEENGTK